MTPELIGFGAQTEGAKNEVAKVTGRIVSAIYKGESGVILQFRDSDESLLIMSSAIPQFNPKQSEVSGYMEIELTGVTTLIVVSVRPIDFSSLVTWKPWDDPDAQSLIGQMLIGYSYIMVPMSDGSKTGAACVELSGNRMLGVTIYEASILAQQNPPKVS